MGFGDENLLSAMLIVRVGGQKVMRMWEVDERLAAGWEEWGVADEKLPAEEGRMCGFAGWMRIKALSKFHDVSVHQQSFNSER
jgi:hypothetical protein